MVKYEVRELAFDPCFNWLIKLDWAVLLSNLYTASCSYLVVSVKTIVHVPGKNIKIEFTFLCSNKHAKNDKVIY